MSLKVALPTLALGLCGGGGTVYLCNKHASSGDRSKRSIEENKYEGKLSEDQQEISKKLWGSDNVKRQLIEYSDTASWTKKAKEYSLQKDIWPGDIIFVEDKSDENLGALLREKCYSVSRWFSKGDWDNNSEALKQIFGNAKDGFTTENMKKLCTMNENTPYEYKGKVSSYQRKTLNNLMGQNYECNKDFELKEPWMKELYDLKKDGGLGKCKDIKSAIVGEATFSDGSKKYDLWTSRKTGASSYEAEPIGDWVLYDSIDAIPGIKDMFTKKA